MQTQRSINRFINWLDLLTTVSDWPTGWRRAWVLIFPVSFALQLVLVFGLIFVVGIPLIIIDEFATLWKDNK